MEPSETNADSTPQSSTDPPRCAACGYNLTGLDSPGTCPECGTSFDLNEPCEYVERPPFGHLLLLIPPALLFGGWLSAFAVDLCTGALLLVLTPIACLALGIKIARRLSVWRYCVALRRSSNSASRLSRQQFITSQAVSYVFLQGLGCLQSWWLVLTVITRLTNIGVLSPVMP